MSVPKIKEPYMIDQDEKTREKLVRSLYPSFDQMADFSNTYFWDEENAAKIHQYNSDARIIITVRRPSRRIISHFEFIKRNGEFVDHSLAEYLTAGDKWSIVSRSDYRPIIDRYTMVFGAEQVLVLPLEMLKSNAQGYFDRLTDFCGFERVPLTEEDKLPVLQRASTRSPMAANVAKATANLLRRLGMLRLLGNLKDSSVVQSLLYRPASGAKDSDFGKLAEKVSLMDQDYESLLDELGLKQ